MEGKTELQRNAISDARKKELMIYQRASDIQGMNNRMENSRMGQCLALIKREADMERAYHERTDHAAIVNAKARKETALGLEIAKVKREEDCKLLRRHYIRERDPTLRELARKLQAGYVCRDLQQQILHNEYKRLQLKVEDKRTNENLNAALHSDQEALVLEKQQKLETCNKYGQELRQQLVARHRQKQCQYEDTLIEKKMLDEIMRTIADEDKRELQQKRELKEKTRQEMVTFKKAQDSWRKKQTEMVVREQIHIERQQQAVSDRDAAIVAERARRLQEKEESNARIAAKLQAEQDERQKREDLIQLLQEQEYLENNIQEDIAAKEKLRRVGKETKEALTEQMETKKRLNREHKERELKYREQTTAKIAQEEEKERLKKLEIREKNKKHCSELLQQAEQHRRKMKEMAADDERRARAVNEYHHAWQAEVSEERKEILSEHAPRLLGYLQPGVIQPHDLPAVKEGASNCEQLATLNIAAITQKKRPQRFAKCNAQCMVLRDY